MKKRISLLLVLMLAFTMVCGSIVPVSAATKPTKMTITATAKTVDIGGQVTVKVKSVSPSKASKAVTFKSSKKSVATVSSKGVVTGKKKGTATITVTSKANKKLKKTIKITVKRLDPTVVVLPESTLLAPGKSTTLVPTLRPVGICKKGTWKSSDKNVFTVTSSGKVTGVNPGTATVSFTIKGVKTTGEVVVLATPASNEFPAPSDKSVVRLEGFLYTEELAVVGSSDTFGGVVINKCVFEKGIRNKAKAANVILEGDIGNAPCVIDNNLHLTFNDVIDDIKAGGEHAYPKFIFGKNVECAANGSGLVTAWSNEKVVFNGKKYSKADITDTYEIETGNKTTRKPDMIYVAQYWENNECKVGVFGFAM